MLSTISLLAMATTLVAPTLAVPTKAQFSGVMRHYSPSDGLGACGTLHQDSEFVVGLSPSLFDPQTPNGNPNNNPLCYKRLRISYNGKTVDASVVDRCPGCPNQGDLDLSPAAFSALANLGDGVLNASWEWI
ncbi:hypothetical protein OQA88_6675 [Cercophora sp. LCS_1]